MVAHPQFPIRKLRNTKTIKAALFLSVRMQKPLKL